MLPHKYLTSWISGDKDNVYIKWWEIQREFIVPKSGVGRLIWADFRSVDNTLYLGVKIFNLYTQLIFIITQMDISSMRNTLEKKIKLS